MSVLSEQPGDTAASKGKGARPSAIAPDLDNLPGELKALRQWVCWRYEPPLKAGDKWRKVPYSPWGAKASTTDPKTWVTFEEAVAAFRRSKVDGIGFVFTKDDPYAGIDLDDCHSPETLVTESWALEIIRKLDSYTEQSASGTGWHVLVKADLPGEGNRFGRVEMYDQGRYFIMSGRVFPGTTPTIEERQPEVNDVHASTFKSKQIKEGTNGKASGVTLSFDDERVLELARSFKNGAKFDQLYRGDWQAYYGSQSEADLALCGMLHFITQDAGQIDRLFRRSGLMRDKWDDRRGKTTYGQQTIASVMGDGETYTPPAERVYLHGGKAEDQADLGIEAEEIKCVAWPTDLIEAGYHGLAGELTKRLDPYTEADPVAILFQTLVAYGNLIGRGPHFVAEGSYHYTNLFGVLVGATAKGRKGSSWAHVVNVLRAIDDEWATGRKISGLSSGEGLIWAVRDPIKTREQKKEKGKTSYEEVESDPGVSDKRLLAFEGEFASTLKAITRQGNTLSTTIRQAWDDGNLNTLVKNSPARATDAHISVVGHITRDELLEDLAKTETSNGFANRFLWLCVQRSKELPEGDGAQGVDLSDLTERFRSAVDFAAHISQMRRDDEARELWHSVYHDLSKGQPGLLGLVTSRAEAQVMRLALLYALLDRSPLVKRVHLEAALALWQYSLDSCRWIFGDSLGDPTTDKIIRALAEAPHGLSRTEIYAVLGRNANAKEVTRALTRILREGIGRQQSVKTGGRTSEVWTLIRRGAR